jgi:hypothetical protein
MTHCYDSTLDELLGDPVTQAIMDADRVDPSQLAAMLRSTARAIGSRVGGSAAALTEAESMRFDRSAVGRLSRPTGVFRDTASGRVSESRSRSRRSGAQ